MKSLTTLNPDKHILGSLCKYGHDWQQSGRSARYKHNGLCVVCKREGHTRRMADPEFVEKKRVINLDARRRLLERQPDYAVKQTMKSIAKRKETDDYFNLVERLRGRVRRAFQEYTDTGKIRTSREYGIDYAAIIAHIGPCPGDRRHYHIDHIKALSHFDLTDPEQVKIAFAPKNHQWLTSIENIRKGNR